MSCECRTVSNRSDTDTVANLLRRIEPLYEQGLAALHDGALSSDEELERNFEADLEVLRREGWETPEVRPRMLFEISVIVSRTLLGLEEDPAPLDLARSLVSGSDSARFDGREAARVRDEIAGHVPAEQLPPGVPPEVFTDAALGWRKHLGYAEYTGTATVTGLIGWIVGPYTGHVASVIVGAMVRSDLGRVRDRAPSRAQQII